MKFDWRSFRSECHKYWHRKRVYLEAREYVDGRIKEMVDEGMHPSAASAAAYRDGADRYGSNMTCPAVVEEAEVEVSAGVPDLPEGLELPADVGWVYGHPVWRGGEVEGYPEPPAGSAANLLAHARSNDKNAQAFFASVLKMTMDPKRGGADEEESREALVDRAEWGEIKKMMKDLIAEVKKEGS